MIVTDYQTPNVLFNPWFAIFCREDKNKRSVISSNILSKFF